MNIHSLEDDKDQEEEYGRRRRKGK